MFWIIIAAVVAVPFLAAFCLGLIRKPAPLPLLRWRVLGVDDRGNPATRIVSAPTESLAIENASSLGIESVVHVSLTPV